MELIIKKGKAMKIYELKWYLEKEDTIKKCLITDFETAHSRYEELRRSLYQCCWCTLRSLVENENHELVGEEVLFYNDI